MPLLKLILVFCSFIPVAAIALHVGFPSNAAEWVGWLACLGTPLLMARLLLGKTFGMKPDGTPEPEPQPPEPEHPAKVRVVNAPRPLGRGNDAAPKPAVGRKSGLRMAHTDGVKLRGWPKGRR